MSPTLRVRQRGAMPPKRSLQTHPHAKNRPRQPPPPHRSYRAPPPPHPRPRGHPHANAPRHPPRPGDAPVQTLSTLNPVRPSQQPHRGPHQPFNPAPQPHRRAPLRPSNPAPRPPRAAPCLHRPTASAAPPRPSPGVPYRRAPPQSHTRPPRAAPQRQPFHAVRPHPPMPTPAPPS